MGRNPRHFEDVQAALRAGRTFQYEDEVTRRDGSTFWLGVSVRPLYDAAGRLTHSVAVGADITAKRIETRKKQELQDKLVAEMQERERMVIELQLAQKLESVGRLAAGIAHEINTPIQYVGDSVYFLRSAFDDLDKLFERSNEAMALLPDSAERTAYKLEIAEAARKYDLDYLRVEVPKAFTRTFDGVERVTNIVKAMKEFAHPDAKEQSPVDLLHALQTTLLVASNEYKYTAKVRTEFGELPHVVCNVGELNQVFLNLIVNAAHAIKDAGKDVDTGEISSDGTRGRTGRDLRKRQRLRRARGKSFQTLRPILHDQGSRKGHRTGTRDQPFHRGGQAWRRDRRRQRSRRGHSIYRQAADRRA